MLRIFVQVLVGTLRMRQLWRWNFALRVLRLFMRNMIVGIELCCYWEVSLPPPCGLLLTRDGWVSRGISHNVYFYFNSHQWRTSWKISFLELSSGFCSHSNYCLAEGMSCFSLSISRFYICRLKMVHAVLLNSAPVSSKAFNQRHTQRLAEELEKIHRLV